MTIQRRIAPRIGGVYKIAHPFPKVGGAYKNPVGGWVRESGVYLQFYPSNLEVNLPGLITLIHADATDPVQGEITFDNGGSLVVSPPGTQVGTAWFDPLTLSIGDDYEIMLTKDTGTDPASGPSLASWHALSTTRTWMWERTGSLGTTAFTGEVQIREAVGGAVVATADVDVHVELV